MNRRQTVCAILAALFLLPRVWLAAETGEETKKAPEAKGGHNLPKVPSRATLLKDVDAQDPDKEAAAIRRWARELIAAKEKQAQIELERITKTIRAEEGARQAAEAERRRRQARYDEVWGGFENKSARSNAGATLHIRLDFQVPEIETYRLAVEASRAREALANDILETLPRLARNASGKLTDDDYRDAGAILNASSRLFQKLDYPEEGYLSEAKLETARDLPANAHALLRAGRPATEANGYRIPFYDAKGEGVLDVPERKAMAMAFVEIALRSAEEAVFYKNVADTLAALRQTAAARFADIEIEP